MASVPSVHAEETMPPIAKATVTEQDCLKCHEAIVMTLGRKGKAHKTICLDCHVGHPPADIEIIPKCSRCHTGRPHFEITGCTTCHSNPHTPMEISYTKEVTTPCLSCHTTQNEQLPSKGRFYEAHFLFIINAIEGKDLIIYGDGEMVQSLVYVSDMIDGMVRLMHAGPDISVINLGSDQIFKMVIFCRENRRPGLTEMP